MGETLAAANNAMDNNVVGLFESVSGMIGEVAGIMVLP